MRCRVLCTLFAAAFFAVLSVFPVFAASDSPNLTELSSAWRMTSAKNVFGKRWCGPRNHQFDASQWYTAQHMPRNGPGDPAGERGLQRPVFRNESRQARRPLENRTGGIAQLSPRPQDATCTPSSLKGVNYRADIWLNGHRVANRDNRGRHVRRI